MYMQLGGTVAHVNLPKVSDIKVIQTPVSFILRFIDTLVIIRRLLLHLSSVS